MKVKSIKNNTLSLSGKRVITEIPFLAVFLALVVSFSILFMDTAVGKVVIPLAVITAALILQYPKVYFILFLILRPSLDLGSDQAVIGNINPASIATLFLVLVGVGILFKKENLMKIKENKTLINLNKLFLFFVFISLFSLFNVKNVLIFIMDLLRFVTIIIIFDYAYIYFSDRKDFDKLFLIILASAFLPLCLGLVQYLFKVGYHGGEFNRVTGTFVHPNVFAQYLAIIILMILYFLETRKIGLVLKIALFLLLGLIAFEIIQTYSRATWIALVSVLMLFSLYYRVSKKLLFYFLLGVMLILFLPQIRERFMDIISPKIYHRSSWEWRKMVWEDTSSEIKKHPIVGHGLGAYEQTFLFMAHNDYLRLAFEVGLLGLLSYLAFLLYLLSKSFKNFMKTMDISAKDRYLTLICLIMMLLIMSVVANMARAIVVLIYLFCLAGAFLGIEAAKENNLDSV
ncbi:MAG: O-antigen ligase family protein [Candidatus Omnitrophota bacterium]|nr:MAG: O-antigen ligase family protein [Candidatus Omnitrophota bacterium]